MHVETDESPKTDKIPIHRGVRQSVNISPKLFNLALEVFKRLELVLKMNYSRTKIMDQQEVHCT